MSLLYAIFALNIVWLLLLTLVVFKVLWHYQKLTRGVKGEDLTRIWEQYLDKAKRNELIIRELEATLKKVREEGILHVQKVGVVRFNPFNEIGGNQSFAAALLDGQGDGVVISSLHGRDLTRFYAKPIKNFGAAGFEFSREEQNAISAARKA